MADSNTKKSRWMGIISLIMGALGIILHYVFTFIYLEDILAAETEAAQACELQHHISSPFLQTSAFWEDYYGY